ncbi:uncharacterized protein LOC141903971 [Tubulanus polymorphus]|uniref:uncharacterized protein LOC141903971 n=1 Tax=Tubulanus polymorphus TaxID=672921 RepID=UPI003DA40A90
MVKILIIFAVLAASASASPLLGTDRCTWGPSFWCSHISHASECRAVNHCIDTVWSKQKLPTEPKNGEICTLCEGVIAQVKQMLLDPNANAQVKSFLDKSCTLLPEVESQRQCTQIVNTYNNEVIQMIKSKLLPCQICAALKLCPVAAADGKTTPNRESSLKFTPLKAPSARCDLCKVAFQVAKVMFDDKKSQAEITAFLKKELCAKLGPEQQACNSLVDKNGNLIMQLLANNVDPEQICKAIGFCPFASQTVMSQRSAQCVTCEFVTKTLIGMLTKNASEQQIVRALGSVCTLMPKTVRAKCQSYVTTYAPALIQLLASDNDPQQICTFLGVCSPAVKKHQPTRQQTPVAQPTCNVCEQVMKELESLLPTNATEAQVKSFLDKSCTLLPEVESQRQCTQIVNTYNNEVIQMIKSKLLPRQICTALKLCPVAAADGKTTPNRESSLKFTPLKAPSARCDLCKVAFQVAKVMFDDKKSQAEITAFLKKELCAKLGPEQQACNSLVDKNGNLIMQLLANNVDPEQICKAIGFCPFASQTVMSQRSAQCVTCEFVTKTLIGMLTKNASEQQIVRALGSVCTLMPKTVRAECQSYVTTYAPALIQLLASDNDPQQICTFLGVCSPAVKKHQPTRQQTPVAQPTCNVCEQVMKELESLLPTNATEAQVKSFLDKSCTLLPEVESQRQCTQIVNTYNNEVIQMIKSKLLPRQICAALKLCPVAAADGKTTPNRESSLKFTPLKAPSARCDLCKFAFQVAKVMFDNKKSQAEITAFLKKELCAKLGPEQQACNSLVDKNGNLIMQLLANNVDPEQICKAIGFCPFATKPSQTVMSQRSAQCVTCEFVTKTLIGMLTKNASEQQIVRALGSVCTLMPKTVRAECQSYVTTYAPALIQLLASDNEPQQICTFLGVCSPAVKKHQPTRQQTPVAQPTCNVCEQVMKELESLLPTNATETDIVAAFNRVCALQPMTISAECTDFVNQYGTLVIQLLVDGFAPVVVCKELGLCPTVQTKVRASGEVCRLCKMVMSYLAMLLREQSTAQTIDHAVERVCNFLPAAMKKPCDDMIEQYGPFIIQKLDQQLVNPADVCAAMEHC